MAAIRKVSSYTAGDAAPTQRAASDELQREIGALWATSVVWLKNVAGTGNAITAAGETALTSYASYSKGQAWWLPVANTNSGATTINVDGRGTRAIKTRSGAPLVGGELKAGSLVLLLDDGTNLRLIDAATASVNFIIDGGGSAITTGVKGDIRFPYGCTILSAAAFADVSGSISVDVWKDTLVNFPPTNVDSIVASAPIEISAATYYVDTALTGWTTDIAPGDVLRFNVDSASTITRLTIELLLLKD